LPDPEKSLRIQGLSKPNADEPIAAPDYCPRYWIFIAHPKRNATPFSDLTVGLNLNPHRRDVPDKAEYGSAILLKQTDT